jgi:hypothetical protein
MIDKVMSAVRRVGSVLLAPDAPGTPWPPSLASQGDADRPPWPFDPTGAGGVRTTDKTHRRFM